MRTKSWLFALIAIFAGCRYAPNKIPIVAAGSTDLAALAGEWNGDYTSVETGRSGSIFFRLKSQHDSAAIGEVLMAAPRASMSPNAAVTEAPRWSTPLPTDQVLTINFVRAEQGMVSGLLDPYRDPTCGCLVETRFSGHITGDVIEGTFTTRQRETGTVQNGRWKVNRAKR
jgi:hypothetical protein